MNNGDNISIQCVMNGFSVTFNRNYTGPWTPDTDALNNQTFIFTNAEALVNWLNVRLAPEVSDEAE